MLKLDTKQLEIRLQKYLDKGGSLMVQSIKRNRQGVFIVRSKYGTGSSRLTLVTMWRLVGDRLQMICGERSRPGRCYRASISPTICAEAFRAVWEKIYAVDQKKAKRRQLGLDLQLRGSTVR